MPCIILIAATTLLQASTSTASTAPSPAFPQNWAGTWRGTCTTRGSVGSLSFDMEIHIAPTDDPGRYQWHIIYIDGEKRQVRPYELLILDAAEGRYVIDEKNGIQLESTFIDGGLYSQFDIGKVRISASYRVNSDQMLVELITTDLADPTKTGGEGTTPQVTGYTTKAVQRAVLSRQD